MSGDFDPSAPAAQDAGVFGLPAEPEAAGVWLVPVPYEATTSYGKGTAGGPAAILEASRQVDLFDIDTGRAYEAGIVMLPAAPELAELDERARGADTDTVNACSARVNEIVGEAAAEAFDAGRILGVVGGDHATPFGAIADAAERFPGLGILHVDAHHDLRVAYEGYEWSHASIMHNVMSRCPVARLVQVAVRDFCEQEHDAVASSERRIICYYDSEISRSRFRGVPFRDVATTIVSQLPGEVWVSFDVDGLDPSLCPNTGTPVPGGLDFNEAVHLLRTVVDSGRRIVGFDLCEVAPGADEWDANVGARLLYKLCGFALASRERG